MTINDPSMRRRLDALESRVVGAELGVEQAMQFASTRFKWPRDMFLGYTYASSVYPTSGDTFQVRLVEGDFALTDGTVAVNEVARGTVVYARTWPAQYLAEGTQVIVKRIRGLGAEGRGEYWIEPRGSAGDPVCQVGAATTGWNPSGSYAITTITPGLYIGGGDASALRVFPDFGASNGAALNNWIRTPTPAAFNDPWGVVVKAGRYLLIVDTQWLLYDLTVSQNDQWYKETASVVGGGGGTYSIYGKNGPFGYTVRTKVFKTAVSLLESRSTQLVKTKGASASYAWASSQHVGAALVSLAAGEEMRISVAGECEVPGLGSMSAYLPVAQIEYVRVMALYCGPLTNY